MGEIRPKTCEGVGITFSETAARAMELSGWQTPSVRSPTPLRRVSRKVLLWASKLTVSMKGCEAQASASATPHTSSHVVHSAGPNSYAQLVSNRTES